MEKGCLRAVKLQEISAMSYVIFGSKEVTRKSRNFCDYALKKASDLSIFLIVLTSLLKTKEL